jgi:hypothetical protein
MIPITIKQPFTTPPSRSDIISHINNTTTRNSPNLSQIPVPSHHASPIPRLIVDEAVLQSIQQASNNTFRLNDPCLLFKRQIQVQSFKDVIHRADGKDIVSKPHPLFEIFRSCSLNQTQTITPTNMTLDDIIFHDLFNVPQIYLPCLLEITTETFNTNPNEEKPSTKPLPHSSTPTDPLKTSPILTYLHPDSLHFGLQFGRDNQGLDADITPYWLVPIKPQYLHLISKLNYHISHPSSTTPSESPLNGLNYTVNKPILPTPALPEAVLHQFVNNSNQLNAQYYKSNHTSSNPLVIKATRFNYSYIASTYSLFSTLTHRITTIAGQNELLQRVTHNNDNLTQSPTATATTTTTTSAITAPSQPGRYTAIVQTFPIIDTMVEQKEIEKTKSMLDQLSTSSSIQPSRSNIAVTPQSPNIAKLKFSLLSAQTLLHGTKPANQTQPFSKWLSSMSLLYLVGQISPPSSSHTANTTLLTPLPYSDIVADVYSHNFCHVHDNDGANTTLPITIPNQYSQLLQFSHHTLALATSILNSYNIITGIKSPDGNPIHYSSFLPSSPLHKPYLSPTPSNPLSLALPTPEYLSRAKEFILGSLFSRFTPVRSQSCSFSLICGPYGSGKKHFISALQDEFYRIAAQQTEHWFCPIYPVVVTLNIEQLRQVAFQSQSTSFTIPYFTSPLSPGSINMTTTVDPCGVKVDVVFPQIELQNRQSVLKILDYTISTILSRHPSCILHLENFELMTPIQLPYQNSSGSALHLSETDQDYAIFNFFQTLKDKLNFNPHLVPTIAANYNPHSPIHSTNPSLTHNCLAIIATTTALQPTDELHPLMMPLFDNITHIPTLTQKQRFEYLTYFVKIISFHQIQFKTALLSGLMNELTQLNQVLNYISSITRGCTISQLKLLIERAFTHEATFTQSGLNQAQIVKISPFSLLLSTQSIQQLIEIDQSGKSPVGTLLPSLLLFPTKNNPQDQDISGLPQEHSKVSIWNLPVEEMIVLQNNTNKQIISLANFPQFTFYRAYTPIKQLLTVITAHIHILPILKQRFELVRKQREIDGGINTTTNTTTDDLLQWLPTGLLLVGPHTSGKTYIIRSIIQNVLKLPCLFVSQNDIISSYVGESEKNLKNIFIKAQSLRPCVLIFDDLHDLTSRNPRDRTTSVNDQVSGLGWEQSRQFCPIHSDPENQNNNDNFDCLCQFSYEHFDSTYHHRDVNEDDGDSKTTSHSLLSELMASLDRRHINSSESPQEDIIEPIYVIGTTTSTQRIPSGLLSKGRFEQVIQIQNDLSLTPMNESKNTIPETCSLLHLFEDILSRKLLNQNYTVTNGEQNRAQILCQSTLKMSLKQQALLNTLPVGTLQTFLLTALQYNQQRLLNIGKLNGHNGFGERSQEKQKAITALFGRTNTKETTQDEAVKVQVCEDCRNNSSSQRLICLYDFNYAFDKMFAGKGI